jgi:AcrR family transcriptional regulator
MTRPVDKPAGRRRLDPEARREEILKAAARAFAARPYDQVHVEAIARDAGASRALVNHYFDDKRGLFLAVAQEMVRRIPAAVRTDLDLDVGAMVDANTTAWLDLVEAGRETFLLFVRSGPLGRDPELEALIDRLRDGLADRMLSNHLGTTEIPPAAHFTMRAALGAIERAVQDWLTGRGGTREQTHALVAGTILAAVRQVLPAVEAAGSPEARGH